MSNREAQIQAFLNDAAWGTALRQPILGDASTRRYERLRQNGDKAILMEAPKGAESGSEPDGATVQERKALGYNAVARLAGPNLEAFVALAEALTSRGFSAPKILAADLEAGLLILEDLGEDMFAPVLARDSGLESQLYKAGVDILAAIYRSSFPARVTYQGRSWHIRQYDEMARLAELDLYLDWYVADMGYDIQGDARAEWTALWCETFKLLDAHAPGLALRDYHAENLFWLPEREAISRVGLIDFQDGLFTHPAYDLVSFIEDARRDVSIHLADPLIARFCEKTGLKDNLDFRAAYALMGAQRNAKILGIFVRLAKRDQKPAYYQLIPRVLKNFHNTLCHPALTDIKTWMVRHVPDIFRGFV